MTVNLLFSILGFIGGLVLCAGDILFDLKGKDNQKFGTSGNIDSNWVKMAYWRFGASILVALVGDVLAGLGIFSLADQTLEVFYKAVILPFLISYLIFMIVPVGVMIAILTDCLAVPKWFALLNSLVFFSDRCSASEAEERVVL